MAVQPDLLIAAAFDLDGGEHFSGRAQHMVGAMQLGKAGPTRYGSVAGAFLAARQDVCGDPDPARPREFAPHCGPDGTFILLAGRIHDRAELAARHGIDKVESDAQIYAQLHARHGDQCDRLIRGDYAVIQWNPAKRSVRLARSATSFCPLHIWRQGSRIVVASIPRVLFAAGLDPQIDDRKLGDALLLNYREAARSWYQGCNRIESGTFEHHTPDGSRVQRFWSVHRVPEVQFANDTEYVEAVDEEFRRATLAEIEGIARPAIALSGGLDSQAVASYLIEQSGFGFTLPSFTSVPQAGWMCDGRPTSFGDEAPYVRALAEMYPQLQPQFLTGEDRAFGSELEDMHLLTSWPTRNEANMHWIHEAYARAGAMGCDAMFFGGAGNSGFSYDGLTGYPSWLRNGHWTRLARELTFSADKRPLWRRAISLALMPLMPIGLKRAIDRHRPYHPSPFTSWCPMREDFAQKNGALARARAQGHDPYFYDSASAREWRAHALGDLLSEGPEIFLGLRLLHGVRYRDPTLYQPLLELCIGISDEQYLRDGEDRWLARRLLRGKVPEMVRCERKAGRQAADWAQRFSKVRETLLAELENMRDDPFLAHRLDLDRLIEDLRLWPGTDDPAAGYPDKIFIAISRAVSTARFLRYATRRNVGG
jgi:asparagine synthase (glutamine-hydrolysing)